MMANSWHYIPLLILELMKELPIEQQYWVFGSQCMVSMDELQHARGMAMVKCYSGGQGCYGLTADRNSS